MFRLLRKHRTKIRLAIGLTSITITFMLLSSMLPILPDSAELNRSAHMKVARAVAANGTLLISQNDVRRMEAVLSNILTSDTGVKRVEIVRENGEKIFEKDVSDNNMTLSQISAPIWQGEKEWGEIRLFFLIESDVGLVSFYKQPMVRYILLVSLLCFTAFFFYLGSMLKMLDPSQAIPDRVRSALDTMAEGLLVLDAKQNIVLANHAFSHLVGKTQSQLIGVNSFLFNWQSVSGKKIDAERAPWAKALKKCQPVMAERIRLRLNEGEEHTFMVNCSPVLGDTGKAGGVLVSFDDVTVLEQKELELMRSKEEAEIANQTKSDFLANMSHEIRTPMNAIMGFTEVLRHGYGDLSKNIHYLDTISKNSRHLLELINDILDLSKVESGQIEVEKVPTKLHSTIFDVVEVLSVNANDKNIQLLYEPQNEIPEEVITDSGRFRQILTNLVGNAIKFTQNGSVTVRTHWSEQGLFTAEVIDTGIGMTASQLENVFDPFVQADSSITRKFGGTGLGLTISKKFANALGGDITVTSKLGEGSCFKLTVGALAVEGARNVTVAEQQSVNQASDEEFYTWKLPNAQLLVVDDSEENRDLVEVLLESHGLCVTKISNAIDAIDLVNRKVFDVILMDVQMPGMDGYTAVKRLRETGIDKPIFALTAHAMKGIEQKCLAAGFSGYIGKPIKIDLLLEVLGSCLGGEKTVRDRRQSPAVQISRPLQLSYEYWDRGNPIRSSFHESEKFRPIIRRFVEKLLREVHDMDSYFSAGKFVELTELAHRLKGSAGTVGFEDFTSPFHQLEQASVAKDKDKIARYIGVIKEMTLAIDCDGGDTSANKDIQLANAAK